MDFALPLSLDSISWLRPAWLWALVPICLLMLVWWWRRPVQSAWESMVDVELQPYVLESGSSSRSYAPLWLFLAWIVTVLVLAGPVWQQQDVPVFEGNRAEVVLLDLSLSMYADDLQPDRITRIRYKLSDLLERSEDIDLALIAFAERPYVISPLTDDASTIGAFVPSLSPSVMPVQGSRPDLAITRGVELLEQAGIPSGHLLLVTDARVGAADIGAARAAFDAGHVLSVLMVGTEQGGVLRMDDGNLLRGANGEVVQPKLAVAPLQQLARVGGGEVSHLTSDDSDLKQLLAVRDQLRVIADALSNDGLDGGQHTEQHWVEWGPWVVFLLAGGALLLFRRGWIA